MFRSNLHSKAYNGERTREVTESGGRFYGLREVAFWMNQIYMVLNAVGRW